MSDPDDRAVAVIATHLLAQGAMMHRLSSVLTITSVVAVPLLVLMLPPTRYGAPALATLAAIAGLAELWLAFRVAFDARIFALVSRGDATDGLTLPAFDAAMSALELMPKDKTGRPVAARLSGAMRLLRWQAALLLAQVAILLVGAWILVATGG